MRITSRTAIVLRETDIINGDHHGNLHLISEHLLQDLCDTDGHREAEGRQTSPESKSLSNDSTSRTETRSLASWVF